MAKWKSAGRGRSLARRLNGTPPSAARPLRSTVWPGLSSGRSKASSTRQQPARKPRLRLRPPCAARGTGAPCWRRTRACARRCCLSQPDHRGPRRECRWRPSLWRRGLPSPRGCRTAPRCGRSRHRRRRSAGDRFASRGRQARLFVLARDADPLCLERRPRPQRGATAALKRPAAALRAQQTRGEIRRPSDGENGRQGSP